MEIHVKIVLKWMFTLCVLLSVINADFRLKPPADVERIKRLNDKYASMIEVPGGKFKLGVNDPKSKTGEYPPRERTVRDYYIDIYPVTVSQYRKFKQNKTQYRSAAEVKGWSYVFEHAVSQNISENSTRPLKDEPWWLKVETAAWNRPEGPGSTTLGRNNYPIVHLSFDDAVIYCRWAGKRLPTENEWELAARGGLKELTYPWGDRFKRRRMNYWQGKFPDGNKVWDEWEFISPVDAYPPQNDYGMYDLVGNVWEWTTTEYYQRGVNRHEQPTRYVLKGGSYLDTRDGDDNFVVRTSTRRGLEPIHTAHNVGFRCAVTAPHVKHAGAKANETRPKRTHKVHEMHDQRAARAMKLKREAEQEKRRRTRTATLKGLRDEF